MSEKSLEDRVWDLENRNAMYGPIRIGGPCEICGQENHFGRSCEQYKAEQQATIMRIVEAMNLPKLRSKTMGTFRVEVQAVGGHGCKREAKDGETVEGCGLPSCPDCITRNYVQQLKAAGVSFSPGGNRNADSYATITHWPGQRSQVIDDLLTKVRTGSFWP